MHVASIAAPRWVPRVQRGPYHMVLAPVVLRHRSVAAHYQQAAREGVDTIILDNGAFEGEALHFDAMDKAIELIKPDVVVLPDAQGDAGLTLKRSADYVRSRPDVGAVMFVPHGQDVDEVGRCVDAWLTWWESDGRPYDLWLGVPCYRYADGLERHQVASLIRYKIYTTHLLGIDNLRRFLKHDLPAFPWAYGVDSSYPFVAATHGVLLGPHAPKWDLGEDSYEDLAETAVRLARLNDFALRRWTAIGEYDGKIDLRHCWMIAAAFGTNGMAMPVDITFNPELALKLAGVPSGVYVVTKDHPNDRLYKWAQPWDARWNGPGRIVEIVQNPYRR